MFIPEFCSILKTVSSLGRSLNFRSARIRPSFMLMATLPLKEGVCEKIINGNSTISSSAEKDKPRGVKRVIEFDIIRFGDYLF